MCMGLLCENQLSTIGSDGVRLRLTPMHMYAEIILSEFTWMYSWVPMNHMTS